MLPCVLVIGIAGPSGAGKSTVCRLLSRRPGVEYLDCDELAHASYRPGGPAYRKLITTFGPHIVDRTGEIDRLALGELVFEDPRARADLEAIVHPEVARGIERAVAEATARGTRFFLVEGALLLSSPYVDRGIFDAVIWLSAPEAEREKRLLSAGLSAAEVKRRLSAQRELKPQGKDVLTIDASGPPEEVAERIWRLLEGLEGGRVRRDVRDH